MCGQSAGLQIRASGPANVHISAQQAAREQRSRQCANVTCKALLKRGDDAAYPDFAFWLNPLTATQHDRARFGRCGRSSTDVSDSKQTCEPCSPYNWGLLGHHSQQKLAQECDYDFRLLEVLVAVPVYPLSAR